MMESSDLWIDRRRLKRRLTAWRIVAIVAAATAVLAVLGHDGTIIARPYVARLSIEGVILDDQRRSEALRAVADDDRVKALIVRIDSPGGTVVGGEALYTHLRAVAARKPVVAVMGEIATSAAYMAALGSDHVIAREGTLTGSIGVVLQTAEITGLMEKIGIKPETVKSGPLKAQPNPFEPLSPEARQAVENVIRDTYDMFVGLVRDRRALPHETVVALADGRIYTGRQAVVSGMVDALGGEPEARTWLSSVKGVDPDLDVREVRIADGEGRLRDLVSSITQKVFFSETLRLDGLISLWQPRG
jgi:protease-4